MHEPGAGGFIAIGADAPVISLKLAKLDNGYSVELMVNPKLKPIEEVKEEIATAVGAELNPPVEMTQDEIIDRMVDGLGAFLRSINDKGAGENWKGEDEKGKIREAVKLIFPQVSRQTVPANSYRNYEPPHHESKVFETKAGLMKYLDENL